MSQKYLHAAIFLQNKAYVNVNVNINVNVRHTYWAPFNPITEALHAVELTLFLWHTPEGVAEHSFLLLNCPCCTYCSLLRCCLLPPNWGGSHSVSIRNQLLICVPCSTTLPLAQTAGVSRSREIQYGVGRVKWTFPGLFLFYGGTADVIALVEVLIDTGRVGGPFLRNLDDWQMGMACTRTANIFFTDYQCFCCSVSVLGDSVLC